MPKWTVGGPVLPVCDADVAIGSRSLAAKCSLAMVQLKKRTYLGRREPGILTQWLLILDNHCVDACHSLSYTGRQFLFIKVLIWRCIQSVGPFKTLYTPPQIDPTRLSVRFFPHNTCKQQSHLLTSLSNDYK